MMMKLSIPMMLWALVLLPAVSFAKNKPATSPQAAGRTHAQNYKDMVLANCIARAYKSDQGAPVDAGSSATALREWPLYDLEKAPDAIDSLVDNYLARDYFNPLAESEVKGIKFDLLKCLDLYHSKELDSQVKRLVLEPNRTERQNRRSRTVPAK